MTVLSMGSPRLDFQNFAFARGQDVADKRQPETQ